jgi:peptide deformylase
MVRPIFVYGHTVLRKRADAIPADFPKLAEIIQDMFDTMYNANGVGLAAPQIGLAIRLFVVDGAPFQDRPDNAEDMISFKKVFVNPEILDETGEKWGFEEGCLSIPDLRDTVHRCAELRIRYEDENRVQHEESYSGLKARIIQHEFDHINGVLFIDHLSPLRKQLIKGRLGRISRGENDVDYPLSLPNKAPGKR